MPLQFSEALFEELFCYIDAFEKTDEKSMIFYLFSFSVFFKAKTKVIKNQVV